MTNKSVKLILVLLFVTFIFFRLGADRCFAQEDSADVAIIYTTAYPGNFVEVAVKLKNPMEIAGFDFTIQLSNPELLDFHTDSIRVDSIFIPVDTCTWEPDTLHGDTCFVDSLSEVRAVRFCSIDTVGSLISDFQTVECKGETGDTSRPDCNSIWVFGMASHDSLGHLQPIPPSPSYRTLFKFGVDVACLPDSADDRTVAFLMAPGGSSFLSDQHGNFVVPFRYDQGEVSLWWSVSGDANADSTVDIGDVVFLLNYLFKWGPRPCIPEAADANGNCAANIGDVTYLLNFLYRHGPDPVPGCWYGKKKE